MSTSIQQRLEAASFKVLGGLQNPHYSDPLAATLSRAIIDQNDNLLLYTDKNGHLVTQPQTTPPSIASGAGLGTGGSPSVQLLTGARDCFGILRIINGSAQGSASAVVATVSFAKAYATAPIVELTPHNAAAAALSGNSALYSTGETTTGFQVKVGSTALAASTTYDYIYSVLA